MSTPHSKKKEEERAGVAWAGPRVMDQGWMEWAGPRLQGHVQSVHVGRVLVVWR
jgi:hypothetical protein